MAAPTYAEVDYLTPLLQLSVGIVLLIFCLPLVFHGLYRRSKFSQLGEGHRTRKARSSIRSELLVSAAGILGGVTLGLVAWSGYGTATTNFEANIEQRYHPQELSLGSWNGSWATVDITLADGARFTDSVVVIREGYEPFIEDIWNHAQGTAG